MEIAQDLRRRIRQGEVSPDGRVGTFSSLEEDYGAAKNTIDKALGVLRQEGALVTIAGKGIFATGHTAVADDDRVAALESRVATLEAQVMDVLANLGLEHRSGDENASEVAG